MGPGLVQEPPKFKILVKFTYFCPMEVTVYIPVKGKFGMVEYTISPLSHSKFGPDWQRWTATGAPKVQHFVKIATFYGFSPHRGDSIC